MLTRTLCHIWGPFSIYNYGLFIAIGCVITFFALCKDPKRKHILSEQTLIDLFSLSILVGIIGGRLLHLATSYKEMHAWTDIFALHEGGFSILGTIIALLIFIPWYCKRKNIPMLPLLDMAAVYGPLLQSISRLGCYFAGCCYGKACDYAWAIRYTDPDTIAPLNCFLHPTQLYSSLMLFGIFLLLYRLWHYPTKPGELLTLYMFFVGLERFVVDFWRDDREFLFGHLFSLHQWIALGLIAGASILYLMLRNRRYSA